MLKGIDLDIHIVVSIYNASIDGKDISTWKIAKNYNWTDKPVFFLNRQEHNFYTKKSIFISERIKSMVKEGLVKVNTDEKIKSYELIGEKFIKKHKFNGSYKLSLQIKSQNGKWIILEI